MQRKLFVFFTILPISFQFPDIQTKKTIPDYFLSVNLLIPIVYFKHAIINKMIIYKKITVLCNNIFRIHYTYRLHDIKIMCYFCSEPHKLYHRERICFYQLLAAIRRRRKITKPPTLSARAPFNQPSNSERARPFQSTKQL
jgi:hypothetical protein